MNPGSRISLFSQGSVARATLLIVLVILGTPSAFGQAEKPGRIMGKVIDAATGDPLIGVTVMIQGTTMGTATDLDGLYTIKSVPPGTYTLKISSVGYAELIVDEVEVAAGEVIRMEFPLTSQAIEQETVVVTGKRYTNTRAALQVQRRKARQVMDAISAEEISESGSGDAAEAMTRVVGATVMNDDVYVRGLGDRYSNYQLNGVQMPTSDPDKQSVPMNLVPTHLLDNIAVTKSFTPDKPGNFSGGSINLVTKDFHEKRTMSVSFSGGGNTKASQDGDFLTFTEGDLKIPAIWNEPWVDSLSQFTYSRRKGEADTIQMLNESFNKHILPTQKRGPFKGSVKANYGDQLPVLGRKLGINGNISYSQSAKHYDDGIDARWRTGASGLENFNRLRDVKSVEENLFGWMVGINYSLRDNHKIGAQVIGNEAVETRTQYLQGPSPWQFSSNPERQLQTRALTHTDRDLNSLQVKGEHIINPGFEIRADWQVSNSTATMDMPDQRFFANTIDTFHNEQGQPDSTFDMDLTEVDLPRRFFRNVDEENDEYAANLSIPLGQMTKLKTGFSSLNKTRSHRERIFEYNGYILFRGDWEEWIDQTGYRVQGSSENPIYVFDNLLRDITTPAESYDGQQDITGVYGMIELPLTRRLLLITGARYERTDMSVHNLYDPADTLTGRYKSGTIKEDDWLPSMNIIYRLNDQTNFRVAYGRTLARPTMREFAPYRSENYGSGSSAVEGNANLERTLIDNWDLRAEVFPRPGEVLAVSAFYKALKNPIELELVGTNQDVIRPNNLSNGLIFGVELEFRKQLDFLGYKFRNFDFSGNVTLSHSEVDIPETEYLLDKARWPDAGRTREMYGQAPYVINASLGYLHETTQTTVNLHYNRVGYRFAFSTGGGIPNVFEKPRNMVDVIASQSLGAGLKLKLTAKNILNEDFERVYDYRGVEYPYNVHSLGASVSLGMSWSL